MWLKVFLVIASVISYETGTASDVVKDCGDFLFSCSRGKCIPLRWKCDGESDCRDGSDELDCDVVKDCEDSEFSCGRGKCIPLRWKCDGDTDCIDGSDEHECGNVVKDCEDSEFSCGRGKCIPLRWKCDGDTDCIDGSDEHECGRNICVNQTCPSVCKETAQGMECSCKDGYILDKVNRTCERPDPLLIYSSLEQIKALNLRTKQTALIHKATTKAGKLCTDPLESKIYWLEISYSSAVYSSNIDGTDFRTILNTGLLLPEDIAVDYVGRNLYLTDSKLKQILVCKLDGSMCHILHSENVQKPRAIEVDPSEGLMYWSDWGDRPGIFRSGMDASDRIALVTQNIKWPNDIAIDYATNRLFWVDAGLNAIEYVTLDGQIRKMVNLLNDNKHPYSLTVFEDLLYWTEWSTFSVESSNKFSGNDTATIVHEGIYLMGVQAYHPTLGKKVNNPCLKNNCSHMCLIAPRNQFKCVCPTGYILSIDERTCLENDSFPMLYVSGASTIYNIRPEAVGNSAVSEWLKIDVMGKLAFDWRSKTLFAIDKNLPAIYAINMTSLDKRPLVTKVITTPEDIAFDWMSGNLYWIDSSKGTVEIISPATTLTTTIIDNLTKPVSILLVPQKSRMFISTLGEEPLVVMYGMDGSNRTVLTSIKSSAVVLAAHPLLTFIYWIDSPSEKIAYLDYSKPWSDFAIVKNGVKYIASMAASEKYLYWTNVGNHTLNILPLDTTVSFIMNLPEMENEQVSSKFLHYVNPSVAVSADQSPCMINNGGCSHLCVTTLSGPACMCPIGMTISEHGTSCIDTRAETSSFIIDDVTATTSIPDAETPEFIGECYDNDFKCANGRCILLSWKCDSRNDCGDNSDEIDCARETTCKEFVCGNGECVAMIWRCDEELDCFDGSDEQGCEVAVCEEEHQFRCTSGQCIPKSWICDDTNDCIDGLDEKYCHGRIATNSSTIDDNTVTTSIPVAETPEFIGECYDNNFKCANGTCILAAVRCDSRNDCGDNSDEIHCNKECSHHEFQCKQTKECVPLSSICNGITDCEDGTDENYKNGETSTKYFSCRSGGCIPYLWRCNGEKDCSDNSDEESCNVTVCNEDMQLRCLNGQCIPKEWFCDGSPDCIDHSDEEYCNVEAQCQAGQHLCDDGLCIYDYEVCDGHKDCSDGGDELNCTRTAGICSGDDYFCANNSKCISKKWICDGDNDCGDAADEAPDKCLEKEKPTLLSFKSTVECKEFFCKISGECIPWSKVCDDNIDCSDVTDEGPMCSKSCVRNGGCSQKCTKTPEGPKCSCFNGYELMGDELTCEDIDECSIPDSCSHFCNNTEGSFKCTCAEGYFLAQDHKKCKADGGPATLVYLLQDQISGIDLNTYSHRIYLKDSSADMRGIDYDVSDAIFFLADWKHRTISSYTPNTNRRSVLLTTPIRPHYLKWDWIARNLYYTDDDGSIIACSRTGQYCTTVIKNAAPHISSFVISPKNGVMFWSVWSVVLHGDEGIIERADMDGSNRVVIVAERVVWPSAMTVDHVMNRIYWSDIKLNVLETSDFNGLDRRFVLAGDIPTPYSMAMFEDNVFWANWGSDDLIRCSKFKEKDCFRFRSKNVKAVDIMVVHEVQQFKGVNRCLNRNCSQMCLQASTESVCKCADGYLLINSTCKKNTSNDPLINTDSSTSIEMTVSESTTYHTTSTPVYELSAGCPDEWIDCGNQKCVHMMWRCDGDNDCGNNVDENNCVVDEPFEMLLAYDDSRIFRFYPGVPGSSESTELPNTYIAIGRLAYDWKSGNLYATDTKTPAIHLINLNTLTKRELVIKSLVTPEDIAFDWRSENLYWVDSSKGTVEVISSVTFRTTILIDGLANPTAIALVPKIGAMFISTSGEDASISMYDMDGSNLLTVMALTSSAVSLSVDPSSTLLYWSDPSEGKVFYIDYMTPESEPGLLESGLGNITSIAVGNSYLYWSDMESDALHFMQLVTKESFTTHLPRLENESIPRRILYTAMPVTPRSVDEFPCSLNNGGCHYLCLTAQTGRSCACPPGKVLAKDNRTCAKFRLSQMRRFLKL